MKKIRQWFYEFIKPRLMAGFQWTRTITKIIFKFALTIIIFASFVSFAVVPFLHNIIDPTIAQWIWYSTTIVSIVSLFYIGKRSKKPNFETQIFEFLYKWGEFLIYPIFANVFVINYYDIDLIWMWVIFGMFALFVPAFFFSLFNFHLKNNNPSEEGRRISGLNIIKSILLYWFIDLFYMSIFNDWLISTFVFGILSIVIIFFNLVNAFLNGAKILRFLIVLEMIIALIMSGYLIFIIPNDSLQEIVLQIATALYGGILALVGVAWTIKDTNEKRQNDLLRIENERREEERKKHIPYVRIAKKEDVTVYGTISKIHSIDLAKPEDREKLVNHRYISIYTILIFLKNISTNNIILHGAFIDELYYNFENAVLIEKDAICKIEIGNTPILNFVDEIKNIELKISDIYDNFYKVECVIKFEDRNKKTEYITPDNKKFYGNMKHYLIEGCKLPELIKEDEKYE